jgi:hypothetical protein
MITLKTAPWKVVKAVYDMCRPVGMGFLQYTPGEMTQEQAEDYVNRWLQGSPYGYISMDYVGGRQCKFHFNVAGYECEINDEAWHDHSTNELHSLIAKLKAMAE